MQRMFLSSYFFLDQFLFWHFEKKMVDSLRDWMRTEKIYLCSHLFDSLEVNVGV